jgi:hypothetical protein
MMSRNLRGFMSLFHSDKPVVCKVHGFCVAGGTDMALCSDLLVDRRRRQDRLSPRARLGRAHLSHVGLPHRRRAGQAPPLHRRLPVRQRGRRLGPRRRVRAPRSLDERFEASSPGSPACPHQPARDDEAAVNQAIGAQGLQSDADPRHPVRRHRPPHPRGLRLPPAGDRREASARPYANATSPSATTACPPSRADSDDERGRATDIG